MTTDLVSTQWLEDHIDDPNMRIVDIRGKAMASDTRSAVDLCHYEDYVDRHIPNAVFVNWVKDITDDPQHKRVAPPTTYADAMQKIGINGKHFVIAYDDASNVLASRLWWTLNYYGHMDVAILDGGWQKWIDEGRQTTSEIPLIENTEFTAQPNDKLRRQGNEIIQLLGGTTRIVDMRLAEEYSGEITLTRYGGHIPGAVNLPVRQLVNEDNTLLEPEQLRQAFANIGVDESAPEVIFYGNVGVVSCLGMLAMRVAGLPDVASNYDASWQEWGNDEIKPKIQNQVV